MTLLTPSREQYIDFPAEEPPRLLVSVDTEEAFDWNLPMVRHHYSTSSVTSGRKAHKIFDRFGIRPTYLVDYPVATDAAAADFLGGLYADGRCSIGAHLHPWTNPPHEEELTTNASFPGNLVPDLERRKLRILTEAIEASLKQRPVVYRAGRYGIGPSTAGILHELGYKIDMSMIPLRDYSHSGGPDFSRSVSTPYWFGDRAEMLEIPLTAGYIGMMRSIGPRIAGALKSPIVERSHLVGLLARSHLLSRNFITPEGMPVDEAKTLTRLLLRDGHRIFTLNYHSPSLEPGNTPYVRNAGDLQKFLSWIEAYCDFFFGELGGISSTPMAIYHRALELKQNLPRAPTPVAIERHPGTPTLADREAAPVPRCLIVASNFPPVRGGSSVVYGNLCSFSPRSLVVLTAWRNYATGEEVPGWRQYDEAAKFLVYRLELLRLSSTVPYPHRGKLLSFMLKDLPLMLQVYLKVRAIVRRHRMKVVCIGELVYGGWLVFACRYLLRCKIIHYIHGEEITVADSSISARMRRSYLRHSDAIVAVSRFTREALIGLMDVPPGRIELIDNGVDLERFRERAPAASLVERFRRRERRILLSVGRLVERKGFDQMLRALPQIMQCRFEIHYIIVGDGPYRSALELIARDLAVEGSVTFAGAVSDEELIDYYALCDLFVLPNREMPDGDTEGFGLVFLEANACGKPVISGRAGGVVDAVHDGVNGLTVDGTNAADIAAATIRLLEDDELYARLRRGGLAAAQGSGWDRRVEQFTELCTRLAPFPRDHARKRVR
jgi:phosphatidyl-myo-inositol dimannoside synthase